jgi:hypothetical protein
LEWLIPKIKPYLNILGNDILEVGANIPVWSFSTLGSIAQFGGIAQLGGFQA